MSSRKRSNFCSFQKKSKVVFKSVMIPSKRTETGARLNLSSSVQPSCVASASRKISTRVFPPNFFFQAQNNRSIAVEKQSAKQKPPIEFYEGIASKQKSTYINSLAKNMLKQRNEKYACVDSDSNAIKLPEQKSKIAAEQQAINDYEKIKLSSSIIGQKKESKKPPLGGAINDRIISKVQNMPGSARISSLISQHASNISSANVQNDGVSTLNFCNDVPYKNNEIKVEILDSEPTHILPDSTCKPACEMAVQKDDQDKLKLLWSYCQEELIVSSELEECKKRASELQKELEIECSRKETLFKRQMEIAQKKKCLIEGKNVEGFMHNTSMDFSAIFQQY